MQSTRARGSRLPGYTSPSPAAALSPTTLLAFRLLSLLDFAELLASPGLAGRAAGSAGGSAAAATAGLPCEIPASTPDSEIAQSPQAGPLAPPPALHSTNKRKACQRGVGVASPLPNDTISLIGLAFCYVPTPVRRELSLNVKGSSWG